MNYILTHAAYPGLTLLLLAAVYLLLLPDIWRLNRTWRFIGLGLTILFLAACASEPNPDLAGKRAASECAKDIYAHPADVTACYVFASAIEMTKSPRHKYPSVVIYHGGISMPSQ